MSTRVGLCLPQLGPHVTGPVVRAFCERAEAAGFASLWVQEHLFLPLQPASGYAGIPGRPVPVPYRSTVAGLELLTAAAAWTSTMTIGTSVLVVGYHRPVELAQRLATLDVLSGGRLVVGLGVGWSADEHEQMDLPMGTRGRRMEDMVHALRACWAPDPVRYESEFFSIPPAFLSPKPLQADVAIIAGAMTPAGRIRVARSFDGWNPAGLPVAYAADALAELQAQRPPGRAPLTMWFRTFLQAPGGPPREPAEVADEVAQASAAGFEHVIIDANFSERVTRPDDWLAVLDDLAPSVVAAT